MKLADHESKDFLGQKFHRFQFSPAISAKIVIFNTTDCKSAFLELKYSQDRNYKHRKIQSSYHFRLFQFCIPLKAPIHIVTNQNPISRFNKKTVRSKTATN